MKKIKNPPAVSTTHTLFELAFEHHQQGRLDEARKLYQQILKIEPKQVDALHFSGVLAAQTGNHALAVTQIKLAIKYANPISAALHTNLANALAATGKIDEALQHHRTAIALEPDFAPAFRSLADFLWDQQRLNEACEVYTQLVEMQSENAQVQNNLGEILAALGKLDAALSCYHHAISIEPEFIQAQDNLAYVYLIQRKFAQAANHYQQVLRFQPDNVGVLSNLGLALCELGQLDAAIETCQHALSLQADSIGAYNNLGLALQFKGDILAAKECYLKAIAIQANHAESQHNLALIQLYLGEYSQETWARHEYRRQLTVAEYGITTPPFHFPEWRGESLKQKSIVIWPEQGLGDEIQFCRYVAVLKKMGAKKITVICKPPLKSLLQTLVNVDQVLSQTEMNQIPAHDYWVLLLSLPFYCKTTVTTIPNKVPYLFAKPELIQQRALSIKNTPDFKVGLCWKGNPAHRNDKNRSPGIAAFQKLFQLTGVKFFTVQPTMYEELFLAAGNQAADCGGQINASNFDDAAAIMMNLDLIISCDTSICHLAGALGKPVWIVLPKIADWRWIIDRNDTPWYPTAKLFRQQQAGNWTEVFERVEAELKIALNQKSGSMNWIRRIGKMLSI